MINTTDLRFDFDVFSLVLKVNDPMIVNKLRSDIVNRIGIVKSKIHKHDKQLHLNDPRFNTSKRSKKRYQRAFDEKAILEKELDNLNERLSDLSIEELA